MRTYIKLFTMDLKNRGLSLYDKAVFSSLVTKYQYHECTEFYTYEAFIADELEISESSVKRSIKTLSSKGLIKVVKKYHKQLQKTVNYYSIPDTFDIEMKVEEKKNDIELESKIDINIAPEFNEEDNIKEDDRDVEIEVMDNDTNPVEITLENEEKEDIKEENKIEEIATIINSINNEETDYESGLKTIHNKISIMKQEQININTGIENYEIVDEIIKEEYNQSAEEYFNQFETMYDLGFSRLEHISDLTLTSGKILTPDDVLNVFKAIKKKEVA